ncbi:MAG: lytic transglycosylase domain-containing protein [Flavobacteriales bacterium]
MKNTHYIIVTLATIFVAILFSSHSSTFSKELNFFKIFNSDYNIYAIPKTKNKLDFCNEEVPLQNPDIWERYDKELLKNVYWQSNTLLLQKRAKKYFPIIEQILKENNIPDDFKYLALIESGLENVTSPAGAKGFWQILKSTGREYGLEVNDGIDERYHLEKSTHAACKFLNSAYQKFGSWTLAAASYNMGKSGIQRQLNRQKQNDYYDLILNQETSRYVFRILAIKEILENPRKYGFNLIKSDYYQAIECKEVRVDTTVSNLADFAQLHAINYKVLKLHNPWLRQAYLPNKSRREYFIKIPKEGTYTFNQTKKDTI